ncbi:MAG: hypothetical protein WCB26_01270, partial [Pseudolabrys sp.]
MDNSLPLGVINPLSELRQFGSALARRLYACRSLAQIGIATRIIALAWHPSIDVKLVLLTPLWTRTAHVVPPR